MSAIETKLEKAIISYLSEIPALSGVAFYEGHGEDDVDSFPRLIVTCAKAGGDAVGSGIYQCDLSIQGVHESFEASALSEIKDAALLALCEDSIPAIKSALNAPDSGPDSRAVKQFALSGIVFTGSDEGRDTERNLHGFILTYSAWCASLAS